MTRYTALFFGRRGCSYSVRALDHLKAAHFSVEAVFSQSRREALPERLASWTGDYIFCFRSYYVLGQAVLERARIAALNFHPGPTEYPGSGGVNWALYDNATSYGATAHLMTEKIDDGPIVECRRFPVLPEDNLESLLARVHWVTFELLQDLTTGLALEGEPFLRRKLTQSAAEHWTGAARKISDVERLQTIDPGCSKAELERRIRATYLAEFPPEIHLHGYRFALKL
jgi:methionyl-tRNA formyltransferase